MITLNILKKHNNERIIYIIDKISYSQQIIRHQLDFFLEQNKHCSLWNQVLLNVQRGSRSDCHYRNYREAIFEYILFILDKHTNLSFNIALPIEQ